VFCLENSITNDILKTYNKEQSEDEPQYMTAQNGVQENPDAPPQQKEMHTIEPPNVPTQHY